MVLADPAAAHWPNVAAGRAHYESYYLRAVDPRGGRGVWIRYTVSVAPGGRADGRLWCTLFHRSAPTPRAVRVDGGPASTVRDQWIRLGESTFGPVAIEGRAGPASWSLRCRDGEPVLEHLPRTWMYRTRLPRTKLVSLFPAALFDGTISVDGETVSFDSWLGMVGHNWGEQHAEEWIWLHGLGYGGARPGSWLDVAVGRLRIGPVVTPWVANGAVSLDGVRIRVGGLGRRVSVDASPVRCALRIPVVGGSVTAVVSASPGSFVEWDYADPDPSRAAHRVINCSVADLSMSVARRGRSPVELRASGTAAYEWGRAAP